MKNIGKIFGDVFGLYRIVGRSLAFKWAVMVFVNLPRIIRPKNLQLADQAMGKGPFRVRIGRCGVSFRVYGSGVFSGIREMYVRDTYLRNGLLTNEDNEVVVDLGANIGNFTNLALAHGESINCVSVEPNQSLNASFQKSVTLNTGFIERSTLIRAFLGSRYAKQDSMLKDAQCEGAEW
jgi:hypothetical protein